jgi:hypothetical protein
MKIGLNFFPQQFGANSISFQGEPINLKRLKSAVNNGSDAQAILRSFNSDYYDATQDNLTLVKGALEQTEKDTVSEYYLRRAVAYLQEKLGIKAD